MKFKFKVKGVEGLKDGSRKAKGERLKVEITESRDERSRVSSRK